MSTRHRAFTLDALSAALAVLIGATACAPRAPEASSATSAPALVGAWRSKLQFSTGAFASIKNLEFMYVFNAGGTLTESSNYDGAPPVPPAYGVWREIGPQEYEAKYAFYITQAPKRFEEITSGAGWLPNGHGVFTERIRLSTDGQSFESNITYAAFDSLGAPATGGRNRHRTRREDRVLISFVVPAYNEEQHLHGTLQAIQAAARDIGEPYEIVVANDASTDHTRSIAVEFGARVVDVNLRHIAATRNAGARAAAGELLFFVDADTVISDDVIRRAMAALRSGVVGGGATVHFDGPIAWHFRPGVRLTVVASKALRLAFGCFIFCTREVFDAVEGFDETLFASEEIAFSKALKRHGRFVILPEKVTTSGRKLRAHSAWEVFRAMMRAGLQMVGLARGRSGLDAWYGERRRDPSP